MSMAEFSLRTEPSRGRGPKLTLKLHGNEFDLFAKQEPAATGNLQMFLPPEEGSSQSMEGRAVQILITAGSWIRRWQLKLNVGIVALVRSACLGTHRLREVDRLHRVLRVRAAPVAHSMHSLIMICTGIPLGSDSESEPIGLRLELGKYPQYANSTPEPGSLVLWSQRMVPCFIHNVRAKIIKINAVFELFSALCIDLGKIYTVRGSYFFQLCIYTEVKTRRFTVAADIQAHFRRRLGPLGSVPQFLPAHARHGPRRGTRQQRCKFLHLLVASLGAKRVLEVGTLSSIYREPSMSISTADSDERCALTVCDSERAHGGHGGVASGIVGGSDHRTGVWLCMPCAHFRKVALFGDRGLTTNLTNEYTPLNFFPKTGLTPPGQSQAKSMAWVGFWLGLRFCQAKARILCLTPTKAMTLPFRPKPGANMAWQLEPQNNRKVCGRTPVAEKGHLPKMGAWHTEPNTGAVIRTANDARRDAAVAAMCPLAVADDIVSSH
ncbi:hypothetical protein FB451DRAFT_1360631 [Mycena latifolia]|nr:hypothetical protein FB451DRAFT_1360631 [Mycena latifolia]